MIYTRHIIMSIFMVIGSLRSPSPTSLFVSDSKPVGHLVIDDDDYIFRS